MEKDRTNGMREEELKKRIKELEREVRHLRTANLMLKEILWDWGIHFEEKVVH